LRDKQKEFEAAGLKIVVIGQGTPEELSNFLEGRNLPFEVLCDSDFSAYQAYGLVRGTLWQVLFSPQVIAAGVAAYQEGHKVEAIVGDPMQLPGSFVIKDEKVVFAHRGRLSSDLAAPDDLLAAV
jgi:hypothetical protein